MATCTPTCTPCRPSCRAALSRPRRGCPREATSTCTTRRAGNGVSITGGGRTFRRGVLAWLCLNPNPASMVQQESHDVRPISVLYSDSPQSLQSARPTTSAYLPTVHSGQSGRKDPVAGCAEPGAHSSHWLVGESSLVLPGSHSVHSTEHVKLVYEPGSHGTVERRRAATGPSSQRGGCGDAAPTNSGSSVCTCFQRCRSGWSSGPWTRSRTRFRRSRQRRCQPGI